VRIAVLPEDTPESLAARLGPMEHELLVATVELFTRGRVEMDHDRVLLDGQVRREPLLLQSDRRLA
jgi:phosphoribosylglycinamide formyltransferase-1